MLAFWGYLGWSIVALSGVGYVWLLYRVVLFPRAEEPVHRDEQIRPAA